MPQTSEMFIPIRIRQVITMHVEYFLMTCFKTLNMFLQSININFCYRYGTNNILNGSFF